ncbi:MAG: hypothetical protein MHMPM18_005082, partial [Marteilia pararefringens]
DEENLRVQKHKDDEYHQQWKERINKLDKSQIYLRSKIRLENNKGRLIDWLAYIVSEDIIPEAQLEENSKKTADELINENIRGVKMLDLSAAAIMTMKQLLTI